MSKRASLIETYAEDLKTKCNMVADMDLLTRVTIGCGPAIYRPDAALVAGSDARELETVKKNFLVGKLGLADGPELDAALDEVLATYGRDNRQKYRAVVYYMLTKRFGREDVYA
jgi:hypothetical protein